LNILSNQTKVAATALAWFDKIYYKEPLTPALGWFGRRFKNHRL